MTKAEVSAYMRKLGRKGGRARMEALTDEQRAALAASGGRAGKGKKKPRKKPGRRRPEKNT